MEITYLGHLCFTLKTMGKTIIFDPFITGNELAKHIDISKVEADFVLISHGHEDHVLDVEQIASKNNSMLISNYEIINWFGGKGLTGHPLNHGGGANFDFGYCKYVNAIHTSSLPDGSNGGNPGGFIIENEEGTIYFAGDTALTKDMELIGDYHKPDIAILPIGDNFTMGINDAIIAADFIKCNKIIGGHYDTFPYIEIDKKEAVEKFNMKGKELLLFDIGESREFQLK